MLQEKAREERDARLEASKIAADVRLRLQTARETLVFAFRQYRYASHANGSGSAIASGDPCIAKRSNEE